MKQITKDKAFIKPEEILEEARLEKDMVVADFGCGSGHYTVAAGELVGAKGKVYAFDILEKELSQTAAQARLMGLNNVSTKKADLENVKGSTLDATSCDVVIMSNLLHQVEDKKAVLKEAYRVLKTGGKLVVIEWRAASPFGPEKNNRISKGEVEKLLQEHAFRPDRNLDAGSFHYALLYNK